MSMQEDLKSETCKAIDKENQISLAEVGVNGGLAEIKCVAFSDIPVSNLICETAQPSKWEKFKSLFKRKLDLNGTISD